MVRKISKAFATLATAGVVAMLGSGMAMATTSSSPVTQVETQAQNDEIYFYFDNFEDCQDHAYHLWTEMGAIQAGCERVDGDWVLSAVFP